MHIIYVALNTLCTFCYRKSSQLFDVAMSTSWLSTIRVMEALIYNVDQFIRWPTPAQARRQQHLLQQVSGVPGVTGLIDCSDFKTSRPLFGAPEHANRKGDCVSKLMSVCNIDMEYIDVYAGEPGCLHDSRVFRRSPLAQDLQDLAQRHNMLPEHGHLLGDSAFELTPYMITPYRNNGNLNAVQRNFNLLHSATRIIVENSYALLRGRFRCLQYLHRYDPEIVPSVIVASCCLHNVCIQQDQPVANDDAVVLEPGLFNAGHSGAEKRALIADLLYEQ